MLPRRMGHDAEPGHTAHDSLPRTDFGKSAMVSQDKTPPAGLDIPAKGKSLVEPRITEDPAEAGPTSPGHVAPADDPGPETGGYDDHSPSRHPTNEEGGYGAG